MLGFVDFRYLFLLEEECCILIKIEVDFANHEDERLLDFKYKIQELMYKAAWENDQCFDLNEI